MVAETLQTPAESGMIEMHRKAYLHRRSQVEPINMENAKKLGHQIYASMHLCYLVS